MEMEQKEEQLGSSRAGVELQKDAETMKTMKSVNSNVYEVPIIQIMNEIYDDYMVALPETLPETL